MKRLTSVLFSVLLMSNAAMAAADMVTVKEDWEACLASDQANSTAGIHACNDAAYQAADDELNSFYKETLKNIPGDKDNQEIKDRLVKSQKAWVAYKESNCAFQGASMLGGTGEGVIVGGCLVQMTIDRVTELKAFFEIR